jgi:hypothetical protein
MRNIPVLLAAVILLGCSTGGSSSFNPVGTWNVVYETVPHVWSIVNKGDGVYTITDPAGALGTPLTLHADGNALTFASSDIVPSHTNYFAGTGGGTGNTMSGTFEFWESGNENAGESLIMISDGNFTATRR